jgi:PTH1 family peptidyl-tRNA hydrolase
MRLIVGLGNPGAKYERTRHNAGFRVVRGFHTLHAQEFDGWREKFSGLVSEGRVGGEKVVLLLPQTFMNLSGQAVREAADFWKIAPEEILVVSDDLTLPLGKLRLRRDGSAGGHNGLKDIFERFSTEDIPRLRIGIGNDMLERVPAEKFVLEPFGQDEQEELARGLQRATEAIDLILHEGLEDTMNKIN